MELMKKYETPETPEEIEAKILAGEYYYQGTIAPDATSVDCLNPWLDPWSGCAERPTTPDARPIDAANNHDVRLAAAAGDTTAQKEADTRGFAESWWKAPLSEWGGRAGTTGTTR